MKNQRIVNAFNKQQQEDVVMNGIMEYCESDKVILTKYNERQVILATNEAGHNCTQVDLEQLLDWVSKNRPELYVRFIPGNE